MRLKLFKGLFLAAIAAIGVEAYGQDQLAKATLPNQRLKKSDAVKVKTSAKEAMEKSVSASLYTDFNTEYVHAYKTAHIPDTFRIDLRGFVMPTSRTKVT